MQDCIERAVEFVHDGRHVRGRLFLPAGEGPHPAVIMAHGFGGNMSHAELAAAPFAAAGFATCAFDFCGGRGSTSDGATTTRSVLTEAADLTAILDGIRTFPDINANAIFFLGISEGGFVSTYVAAARPDDVAGLALLFPAYCLQDDARARKAAYGQAGLPETEEVMGITLGRIYIEDALSFDIFACMPCYPGPVLIQHGTADTLVDISYSRRAVRAFPQAKLVEVEGAGHGFREPAGVREEAYARALAFMRECLDAN